MNNVNVPQELVNQIAQNKCVVFVGSGLSNGAGLPVWCKLLKDMLDWSEKHGLVLSDREELESYIDKGELLLVADEIRDRLGKADFQKFMAEEFQKSDLKPTDAHRLLPQIPFAAALTSNYDTLLESSYTINNGGTSPHTFTQYECPELAKASRSGNFYVLKVHGTIDRIETVILGKSDYRDVMHNNPAYRQHLKTLFSTSTVFFLGFGLTDPDMLLLLDELKVIYKDYSGKHYALMNDQEVSGIKQKRFEKDYGIKVIPYTPSAPDRPEIKLFLTQLAEQVNEAKLSISPLNKPQLPFELDIESYAKAIEKKYSILDLDTLTPSQKDDYIRIQLGNVYVEQNVRENPPPIELPKEVYKKIEGEWGLDKECILPEGLEREDIKRATETYYSKTPTPVLDIITAESNKYLVILGDPGSGKSTLTRYITLSVLGLNQDDKLGKRFDGYLPLLIELREFVGQCSDGKCDKFLDYFHYLGETQGYHLNGDKIDRYLKDNGKAIVIFDGLDEIFDPVMWERVNRMIVGFALDYPKVQIIVTSRPVGYKRKILLDAGFSHFTIQDFEDEHITGFLDKWYSIALDNEEKIDERKERIMRSLKESASIRQLAGNPLLLTILAIIAKHQEIPRERWKLFDHAAGVLVEHWDINRHLEDSRIDAEFIGEEDKKEMLMRIAFKMQSGPDGLAGNFIHKQVLQQEIEGYLNERFSLTLDRAKVIARLIIDQFRTRNFVLCLYGADFFGFIHRTFLEYFCANAIVEKFNDQEIDIEDLKKDFYGEYWENERWHEVLRLICGMKEKQTKDIIEHLMQVYDPQWFGSRPPWNIVLATKCLSEIRNPEAISETAKELLIRITKLFDMVHWTQDINEFLGEEVVPAVKLVGINWPHKNLIIDWFSKTYAYKHHFPFSLHLPVWFDAGFDLDLTNTLVEFVTDIGSSHGELHQILMEKLVSDSKSKLLAVLMLAQGWHDDPDILHTIKKRAVEDSDKYVRAAAVQALAQGWHDEKDTLLIIKKRAVEDSDNNVRTTAVQALAQGWHDEPETLLWLKERAVEDSNNFVRRAAVQALAQAWHDENETLPWLKERAVEDSNKYVRAAAVQAFAHDWHDEPGTLLWLKERAVEDSDKYVRAAAVQALARGWHDENNILPWLKERTVENSDNNVRRAAVQALAQGWHDEKDTLLIIKKRAVEDSDNNVRRAAVQALAQGWHDEKDTLLIIKKRAVEDSDKYVRAAAVQALAQGWHDEKDTLPWLKERAVEDSNKYVRRAAVQALVHDWHDESDTLPWLKERAVEDSDNDVRAAAVQALAQGWHDEKDTLPWLKERAVEDSNKYVRATAVQALAQGWHDEKDTLPWLKERATEDENNDVRRAAVQALAQGWHDEKDTLPWLKERAVEDSNKYARATAVQALAQGWHDEKDTLLIIKKRATEDENNDVRRAAVQALAQGWHYEKDTLPWLKERAVEDSDNNVRRAAVQALAYDWHYEKDTLLWFKERAIEDSNKYVRVAAVRALARGCHDDADILTWLKKRAVEDSNKYVRAAAVQALARGWHDEKDTLPWLKERAVEDSDKYVKAAAIQALAQGWHDEKDTLLIIKKQAVEDSNKYVRRVAVQALAQGWHDEKDTLLIIKKQAVEDSNKYVRRAAVQALAQGWHDEKDMSPWLKERVIEDHNKYVRAAAVQALAQGWHDEKDTLPWLKERATEDENNDVRRAAVEALAQGWHDDVDILDTLKDRAEKDENKEVRKVAAQMMRR